jgi:tetratricopeptide (TPR) repeat protein
MSGTKRIVDRAFGGALVAAIAAFVVMALASGVRAQATTDSKASFRQLQLGYVALDAGDFDAAIEHYSQALDLAKGDEQRFNALFGLGSAALEIERFDDAREALEAAHELRPNEVRATFLLGLTCRLQGDYDRAVIYLAEAAVRDPELTQAMVELAIAYGALERHRDAERVCREVLEREPDNLDALLGLAVALYHQDKNRDAVVQFRRVLELDPENVRAHYGLGLALYYAGDRDGAMDEVAYLEKRAPDLAAELEEVVSPGF